MPHRTPAFVRPVIRARIVIIVPIRSGPANAAIPAMFSSNFLARFSSVLFGLLMLASVLSQAPEPLIRRLDAGMTLGGM